MDNVKQHQEMGYDRTASMFSPDGLLLQVEYAEKAVKLGSSVLALTTKEGIVFIGDRRIKSKLLIKNSFKKIFEVDKHILIGGSGVMSDGRRLIEQAQDTAQDNKLKYQMPVDILSLVKDLSNIKQHYTQAGGLRPFGVSFLIGGIEKNKPRLYQTTPSGVYFQYTARATGNLSKKINEELEKDFKQMSSKEAIKFGLKLFKKSLENDFDLERFDIVTIDLKSNIKRIETQEIKNL